MWMTVRKDKNLASVSGLDQPDAEVWHRTPLYIVLKVPGHKFWARHGPGPTHDYAPAGFQVWRLLRVQDLGEIEHCEVSRLVEFPAGRKK